MSAPNNLPLKTARNSLGNPYPCKFPWPEDCFVQCGDKGVVLSAKGSYRTAFFEAFPDTFIRGQGGTVEEAEAAAWTKYQAQLACPEHTFERRGESEHGTCISCGLFKTHAFKPLHSCSVCGKPHVNLQFFGGYLCVAHFIQLAGDAKANADRFPLDPATSPLLLRRHDEMADSYREEAWTAELLLALGLIPLDVEDHQISIQYLGGKAFDTDFSGERYGYLYGLYAKWIELNPERPIGALSMMPLLDRFLAGKKEFTDVMVAILHGKGLIPDGIPEHRSAELGKWAFDLFAEAADQFRELRLQLATEDESTQGEVSK